MSSPTPRTPVRSGSPEHQSILSDETGSLPPVFNNDGLFIVPELQRRLAIANQKVGPDVWKKVADVWDGLHFDAKALEQMFVTYNKGEPVGMRGMVDMAKMIFVLSADALLHLLRGLGEEPRDFMMGIRTTERTLLPPVADIDMQAPTIEAHPWSGAGTVEETKNAVADIRTRLDQLESTATDRMSMTPVKRAIAAETSTLHKSISMLAERQESMAAAGETNVTASLQQLDSKTTANVQALVEEVTRLRHQATETATEHAKQIAAMQEFMAVQMDAMRDLAKGKQAKVSIQETQQADVDDDDDLDEDYKEEYEYHPPDIVTASETLDPTKKAFWLQGAKTLHVWRSVHVGTSILQNDKFTIWYHRWVVDKLKGKQKAEAAALKDELLLVCAGGLPATIERSTLKRYEALAMEALAGRVAAAKVRAKREEHLIDPIINAAIEEAKKEKPQQKSGSSHKAKKGKTAGKNGRGGRSQSRGRQPTRGRSGGSNRDGGRRQQHPT